VLKEKRYETKVSYKVRRVTDRWLPDICYCG